MQILIIDNYDSFTFNLSHLVAEIVGAEPVVVRNDECSFEKLRRGGSDAIIISPGPGNPARQEDAGISVEAILQTDVPLLGVCLGQQAIYHAFGGRIEHAPEPVHGRLSPIYHHASGIFGGLPTPFSAVRYHSLVCADPMPVELEKTAWLEDGTVMGIAHRSRPLWGVQFHPESISTEHGRALIENFLRMAGWRGRTACPPPGPRELVTQAPPPSVRRIHRKVDAERLFTDLFADEEIALWLDSSLQQEDSGRFSILAGGPRDQFEVVRYRASSQTVEVETGGRREIFIEDLFAFLKRNLADRKACAEGLPFDFHGGYVGYFGYELKALCGARSSPFESEHPDSLLAFVERFIAIDHLEDDMYFVGPCDWSDALMRRVDQSPRLGAALGEHSPARFRITRNRGRYLRDIAACQRYIRDGESYEICLTNRLYARTKIDPFVYYRRLRASNPAPQSASLKFPEVAVACSSPETFLNITSGGVVETRPIKGTLPRGETPEEDARLRRRLESETKYRAENLMIVDLLRNDLGRVCETGTVRVPDLMRVESYATLHQLVSRVTGRLRAGQSAVDCLRAAFPGGSMTGAPKLRTMELIERLEGRARGIYSGSIGYLSVNGAANLNIVIRTAVFSAGQATIGTGGAITAMSDAEEEWNEMMLKARALVEAFQTE